MKFETPSGGVCELPLFQEGAARFSTSAAKCDLKDQGKNVLRGSAVRVRQLDGSGHCAWTGRPTVSVHVSLFLARSLVGDVRAQPKEGWQGHGTMVIARYVTCGCVGGRGQLKTFLNHWIIMSWPHERMFLFPKMNVYFRKDPHYTNSTFPRSACRVLLFPPCGPLLKIYQNGNLPKECNYAIEKSLNWTVQGNAGELLKNKPGVSVK